MSAYYLQSTMKSNPVNQNAAAPTRAPQQSTPSAAIELAAMREEMAALRAEVTQFKAGLTKQIKNGVLQAFLTIFLLMVALQIVFFILARFS